MSRNNKDFNIGQGQESSIVGPNEGTFHKGRKGEYEAHHSGSSWIGGCKNCERERKAGKHPVASS